MTAQDPPFGHQGPFGGQNPQGQGAPGLIPGQMAGQQPSPQNQPSTYMYQPLYPPAGQQYPGQQQAPGYEYNNQPTQYDEQYAHQPVQQSQYRHQPNAAALRIHVVNLPICITYLLHEPQPPQQWQQQQQQQQQPSRHNIQPTPASPGYDTTQTLMVQRIDTSIDAKTLQAALRGAGFDARALIRIFSKPKYQHPYAFQQLRNNYGEWFNRNLEEDIKAKTHGDFQDALVALVRGPLDHDLSTLDEALNQRPIDKEALMDVLLCRSNADILAITEQYRDTKGKGLLDWLTLIKCNFDDTVFSIYCKILSTARAEDAALIDPADINYKITALQRTMGKDAIVVNEIFTSANNAQLRAMSIAYQQKYHRSLKEAIEKEYMGNGEFALLRMLASATGESGKADADALRELLQDSLDDKRAITYRVLRLHWGDRARLYAAKAAYQSLYHETLAMGLKDSLSGNYGNLMSALIGGYTC